MVSLDADEAELWLGEPFERYRGIDGFRASWSPEDKVIECNVFRADGRLVHSLHGYLEVLNKLRSQASKSFRQ